MQVGEWFTRNKFHAEDFSDIERLAQIKEKHHKKISCVIPTLNEEDNIGRVVSELKKLTRGDKLLDEIVVIDSGSKDGTRKEAKKAGAQFYYAHDILKEMGYAKGKGENLWKSLFVATGDIIVWIDADIKNIGAKYVYGLVGPLLERPNLGFTKAFYQRPLGTGKGAKSMEGGRVTELLARPLINLYFPSLAGFIQPLSGEYAGRREVLEQIPFFTGYGVEIGMLIDINKKFSIDSMAQVDMDERVHRNRPLHELSRMSFEILQAFSKIAEAAGAFVNLEKINQMYTLIEPKNSDEKKEYELNTKYVVAVQRPPMISVPQYREKFHAIHAE